MSGKAWLLPGQMSHLLSWASRPSDPCWVVKAQKGNVPGATHLPESDAEVTPKS